MITLIVHGAIMDGYMVLAAVLGSCVGMIIVIVIESHM